MLDLNGLQGLEWREASSAFLVIIRSIDGVQQEMKLDLKALQKAEDERRGEIKMAKIMTGLLFSLLGATLAFVVQHIWK